MDAIIKKSFLNGNIILPASKSDLHRALICSALVKNGLSLIHNATFNDDINCTIEALKELGAEITIDNSKISIKGFDYQKKDKLYFNARESGSTLRFLIPIFSYFSDVVEIKLSESLKKRPLSIYKNLLKDSMVVFDNKISISNSFYANYYKIDGNISSQFISGLLFLLPLENHDSIIEVCNTFSSKPYVLMTINTLKKFNIFIDIKDNILIIKGNQKYQSREYYVEADYSSASYFATMGLFHKRIDCAFLNDSSLQADKCFIELIKKMKGNISFKNGHLITEKSDLVPINIDIDNCPDLGVLMVLLLVIINKKASLKNTKRLVFKECNRAMALKEELQKFNVCIDVLENEMIIYGDYKIIPPKESINSHNDHRLVMAFTTFAICQNLEIEIKNIECVAKSNPDFFKTLISLGANIEFIN